MAWHGMCELTNGMGTAWARHAMSESAFREASLYDEDPFLKSPPDFFLRIF
jgi:hypothetical protein